MRRFLIVLALLIPAAALAATPTTAQILARAKAASGGEAWNRVHTLRMEGTIEYGGLSGPVSELDDLETGRSVSHHTLGELKGAEGFDGKRGWNQDTGGEVSSDDSPAAKQGDVTSAYQTARAWWFPERWPAEIASEGIRKDGGMTYRLLKITPRGGRPFELWINARTYLIARIVESVGAEGFRQTTYFSDYRNVAGIKLPFKERITSWGGYDMRLKFKQARVNVPVSNADFAMPQQHFDDFALIGGANAVTIPFELVSNHIYIHVTVNGHPLHFLFDSGGFNVLTPEAAKRVGVSSKGAVRSGGVGKKAVSAGFGKAKSLELGGRVKLSDQVFAVIPLPGFSDIEGTQFDGLIGYEVFKRLVVRIDYADRTLTFIKPADFNPAGAGTAVPFTLLGSIPGVKGSIDGLPGEFEVDTGSRAALTLWGPFVKAHDLADRYHASGVTVIGWGVGGSSRGRVARGGVLKIGGVSVHDPLVELSTSTAGAGAAKFISGNIGGGILKHFTVTFDYAHQRMYLKPNRDNGAPMNYDRSGMWVNARDGGFVVKAVMPGGPADKAGLKVGDLITAVNGKPSTAMSLTGFRKMLADGAPGTRIGLDIGEGAGMHRVTLVLRNLVPDTMQ